MLHLLLDAKSPNALIEDSMVYDLWLPDDSCGMHTEACEQIVFSARSAVSLRRVDDLLKRRQTIVCLKGMNKALSRGQWGEGFRSYSRF
jgi:hypothetical protein